MNSRRKLKKNRFSVLLLDYNEYYFEDFAAVLYAPSENPEEALPIQERKRMEGWFRVCSNSFIFEPQVSRYPILRFRYEEILSFSSNSDMLIAKSSLVIRSMTAKKHHPYEFVSLSQHAGTFIFSFPLTKLVHVLERLNSFLRIAQLDHRLAKRDALQTLIHHHESSTHFDASWLEDHRELTQLQEPVLSAEVTPLVQTPGWLQITHKRIYFQPLNNVSLVPVQKYDLEKLAKVFSRRHSLQDIGLEVFFGDADNFGETDSLFLTFASAVERDNVLNVLVKICGDVLGGKPQDLHRHQQAWQNGQMSNYNYLLFLNQYAGRSLKDLTQFHVFPWILADYRSPALDLSDPATFRDLSKPIGALEPSRLAVLQKRMKDLDAPRNEQFLYGTHYSTPGYVLFYLVRQSPDLMLCLQNGRFDDPDRMFNSIPDAWESVLKNPADLKELIPHFYGLPSRSGKPGDFLTNVSSLDLGRRQDQKSVDDVELPKWATSPEDFITKHREALECQYVSQNIHLWIDLIFGCKNKGDAALEADNLFHYLTYEGAVDLDSIEDPIHREAIQSQINEFGQTPRQIFSMPHPQRFSTSSDTVQCVESQIEEGHSETVSQDSRVINPLADEFNSLMITDSWRDLTSKTFSQNCLDLHRGVVSGVSICDTQLCSVGKDGALKVYSIPSERLVRSALISSLALSCCKFTGSDKVFTGSWDNCIYCFSVGSGTVVHTYQAHEDAVSSLDVNDNIMFSGSWDASTKLWDLKRSQIVRDFVEHRAEVFSVAMSQDLAASGSEDGIVLLWDLRQKNLIRETQEHSSETVCVKFSPNGRLLASCSAQGELVVRDIPTNSDIYRDDLSEPLQTLCLSDEFLVVGYRSGEIALLDLSTGERSTIPIPSIQGSLECMDVSSNGSIIVQGSDSPSNNLSVLH